MDIIAKIRETAKKTKRRLVLPEGDEPRTMKAAAILQREGMAEPVLLGAPERVRAAAQKEGADISGVRIVDPEKDPSRDKFIERYFELRKHKGISKDEVA
ncbi:MAG: phosphate acyltransferase, partial [Elusimicrobiota bacterium]